MREFALETSLTQEADRYSEFHYYDFCIIFAKQNGCEVESVSQIQEHQIPLI